MPSWKAQYNIILQNKYIYVLLLFYLFLYYIYSYVLIVIGVYYLYFLILHKNDQSCISKKNNDYYSNMSKNKVISLTICSLFGNMWHKIVIVTVCITSNY